jgi:phage-related protein
LQIRSKKISLTLICPIGHTWFVRIRYYHSARGDEPVRDYIAGLPSHERDDWDEAVTLLGLFGLDAPVSLRQLQGKLWEIRLGRHRVAYVIVTGSEMVLLHAFKKQRQRTARSDLDLALRRAREVLGGPQ